ncbi:MAG TPA: flagellar basal body-associated FliL family protein [Rhizomicrobium sp.]|nr:flagellar basal body-associated FliL family protein [Rhizomicrobium sp.]
MAKKDKAAEADGGAEGEKPEGEAADAAPKKGLGKILGMLKSKKALMIGAPVLLLLLGGGGAGAYFFLMKAPAEHGAEAAHVEEPLTPPKVAFSDMQDILVNIQSNDGTPAYLKLGVSLELEDEEQKAALEPLMPRITDQFQAYLRELRLDDLKGSAGVLRLKEELLRRVNVAAAPYKVRDVLLKEMIVQ